MKRFSYSAKDQSTGKVVKATVQADSERSAAKLLMSQGYIPQDIKEVDDSGFFAKLTGRITTKDKVLFTRQLATLIGAGLPLSQSLHTVQEQTTNKRFAGIIDDITSSVEGGKSLYDAFAKYPDVFSGVFLSLIKSGEASGTLDKALVRIATQQEKDAAMMSKIRSAMTYPMIVLFVILGVIVFMLVAVIPQVKKLYEDLNQQLPFITQVMVGTAEFIVAFWPIVIIAVAALVVFTRQYLKTDSGIQLMDTVKIRVPLFGKMFQKLYMARFARTGQTLLNTGVPMLDMLSIVSQSVNNTIVAKSIDRSAEKVKGGKALSVALKAEDPTILPFVPQMVKIGEQSGKIDEMLGKAAQVYEDELDEQIKSISTAIEPILMVVLAVVAGGLVGAILLPIYGLVNNVGI